MNEQCVKRKKQRKENRKQRERERERIRDIREGEIEL